MAIRHELLQLIARELAGVPASDIKNRRPLDYPISRVEPGPPNVL
jgi:hypothetical protein